MTPRAAITTIFTLNGITMGTWGARVPAIQDRLGVGPGALAIVLAGLSVGAMVAMPIAGRVSSRRGSHTIVTAGVLALGLSLPIVALLPGLALVALGTALVGVGNGTLDVAMNAQGVAIERRLRRRVLASMHAGFSFGGLLGAGAGALAAAAGIGVRPHFFAVGAVVLVVGAVCTRALGDDRADTPAAAHATAESRVSRGGRWRLRGIAFCCLMAEGAAMDWSAVHVRSIGAAAAVAALAYAGFSLAMASGRLAGDRLSSSWGAARLARRGGFAGAAALAIGIVSGVPAVAIAAYVVLGAGLAGIIPLVFRAAARGADAGPAVAAVATTGYLGFIAGPPLIGALASLTSVPVGLLLVVAATLAVGLNAGALEPAEAESAQAVSAASPSPSRTAA